MFILNINLKVSSLFITPLIEFQKIIAINMYTVGVCVCVCVCVSLHETRSVNYLRYCVGFLPYRICV